MRTLEERFWERVDKNGPIIRPELGNCWTWKGLPNQDGYGRISFKGNDNKYHVMFAHRLSWELFHQEKLEKWLACHKCDNPSCVNPLHLFKGTKHDNLQDSYDKGLRHQEKWSPKGEKHPNVKLTLDEVETIKTSTDTGVAMAQLFHVSTATVSLIRNNKLWKGR